MKKIYFAPCTEISSVDVENTCVVVTSPDPKMNIDPQKGTGAMHSKEGVVVAEEEQWGNLW